jgi:hypothetical protein
VRDGFFPTVEIPYRAGKSNPGQSRHRSSEDFGDIFDGFVKSPSVLLGAGLRFNFVVAEGRGGSPSRPTSGNPAGCPYHRIYAPCIWSFLRDHHFSLVRKFHPESGTGPNEWKPTRCKKNLRKVLYGHGFMGYKLFFPSVAENHLR